MAKDRAKQREHLKCGMTKEERLKREAFQEEAELARKEQERREELIDRRDFCGIRQPTPYEAVKRIVKSQRRCSNGGSTVAGGRRLPAASSAVN